uniref:4-alpha-glucanotransferase n=2 Tax=Compsopogon caeruleus TaxID=31354 RepID=A0A7S1T7F8_9RHOD
MDEVDGRDGGGNGWTGGEVKVTFRVQAETRFGQEVLVSGSIGALGEFDVQRGVAMVCERPGVWSVSVVLEKGGSRGGEGTGVDGTWDGSIRYKYARTDRSTGAVDWEAGRERSLSLAFGSMEGDSVVKDVFREKPETLQEIFSTEAFTDVIFNRPERIRMSLNVAKAENSAAITKAVVLGKGSYSARFVVFAGQVRPDEAVYLIGSVEELGQNDFAKAIPMSDSQAPYWSVMVPFPEGKKHFSYKCFIANKKSPGSPIVIEDGPHREFSLTDPELAAIRQGRPCVIVHVGSDFSFQYPNPWRGSGVAVPVFSLRSEKSCGVGEFLDLKKMVDFCVATGNQLLQLLPINDTTVFNNWRDSYPYRANSSFALHPQYLNLDELGKMPEAIRAELNSERTRLNALSQIDYEGVMRVKMSIVKKMYALQKLEFFKTREFIEFFKENSSWLVPHALFRFFTDVNGTANFDQWGIHGKITPKEMEALAAPDTFHFDYIGVNYFIQFHLHKQLTEVAEYATANRVVLKGDLPIGVSRYCTDTWVNPVLFRLNMRAGAPPDYFTEKGQNWGFPTYDWDTMAKDNFAWWRARLGQMSLFFKAYRIDHILGFFRIWEIPESWVTGMGGRYKPAIKIARSELDSRGLWDMDRYVSPYVHDGLVQRFFGSDWERVKGRFFESTWGGRLKFKEQFNTERKLQEALRLPESASAGELQYNQTLEDKLFILMNNLLLLEDIEEKGTYHPRFNFHSTTSFQELPGDWKRAFEEIYQDYFFRRQRELWRTQGLRKLPMMKSASGMLVCGEDLGFVPDCVPSVMDATSILGLRVQRMPGDDVEFGDPATYEYTSVATLSSHDTSTFRGWWENRDEMDLPKLRRYYKQVSAEWNRNWFYIPTEC